MGFNDHLDDEIELPPEAGNLEESLFDPNDKWIATAPKEQQIEAMRRWFLARYEDPANETPYNGREGGYQFIHGGPYDPNDEIQNRFHHVIPYDVMQELIHDLHIDVGDQWAPIHHDRYDYDDDFAMWVEAPETPHQMLTDRLSKIEALLKDIEKSEAPELLTQLTHGAVITALESYLWDTVAYWAENDQQTLRDFVSNNKDFHERSLKLATIFNRIDGIRDEVKTYLQELVWHRLDKIKPLIENGLKIKVPDIDALMHMVVLRHDIIHRGGRTKTGTPVSIKTEDVVTAIKTVRDFVADIETELIRRYTPTPPTSDALKPHEPF